VILLLARNDIGFLLIVIIVLIVDTVRYLFNNYIIDFAQGHLLAPLGRRVLRSQCILCVYYLLLTLVNLFTGQ